MSKTVNCLSCKSDLRFKYGSWIPPILMVLLPKCPFCIMAYSGAMSLCSGKMLYPNANSLSSYIFIFLSLCVLLSIYLNYKGRTTWVALGISIIGVIVLFISQFALISQGLFYTSTAILFFGIWYNGSFHYVYRTYFINNYRKT